MKNNNKGFTLVELLAMLVVLGILMGVTIPNITGILSQSKKSAFLEDATKMVENTKIQVATHKIGYDKFPKINDGECIILTLAYLNDNEDIGKGPNDGTYLDYDSYVIYKRNGNKYEYYVRLIEEKDHKYSGINEINYTNIEKENIDIEKIESTDLKGFDESTQLLQVQGVFSTNTTCNNVKFYK